MKTCEKCGNSYDGLRCPACEEEHRTYYQYQNILYGPPVSPTLYGPMAPEKRKSSWKYIIFILCALIGGLLYWYNYYQEKKRIKEEMQPDVYGPPPIENAELKETIKRTELMLQDIKEKNKNPEVQPVTPNNLEE